MGMFMNVFTLLITNFITILILIDFFDTMYDFKYEKKIQKIFLVIATFITTIINIGNIPMLNLLIYLFVFILLNSFFFVFEKRSDKYINIVFFVIFILLDLTTHFLMELIFSFKDVSGVSEMFLFNIKSMMSVLTQYTMYVFLKSYLQNRKIKKFDLKDTIGYLIITLLNFIVLTIFASIVELVSDKVKIIFFISAAGMILLNIYLVQVMERLSQANEMKILLEQIEKESRIRYNYYKQLEETNLKTSFILHDIKNHLQILSCDISEDDVKKENYLKEIQKNILSLSFDEITKNKILNMLFHEKRDLAAHLDITMQFHIDCTSMDFIEDFDLVTIFSNIIDNAIEEVESLSKEQRKIDIYIQSKGNFVVIKVKNPNIHEIMKNKNRIISNKKNHKGLGLLSVQHSLEAYNGTMVIEVDEQGYFNNIVTIPVI